MIINLQDDDMICLILVNFFNTGGGKRTLSLLFDFVKGRLYDGKLLFL